MNLELKYTNIFGYFERLIFTSKSDYCDLDLNTLTIIIFITMNNVL